MIYVDWGNLEETLLVVKFKGLWTVDEFQTAVARSRKYMLDSPHVVDVMVDMQTAAVAPANIIPRAIREIRRRPANVGHIIVISRNPIWSKIWNVAASIHTIRKSLVLFVHTADDAYKLVDIRIDVE